MVNKPCCSPGFGAVLEVLWEKLWLHFFWPTFWLHCILYFTYRGGLRGASLDEPVPGDQFYISGCCYFHFTDSLPKLMSGKHTKHKEFANFGLGVAVVYPTSVNYYQFGMEFGSFEKRWSCPRERPNVFAEAPVTFLFC